MRIVIYTSGDFPYGGAPESFVRQMALGLHENHCHVEVIRWRGVYYNRRNDTPVHCSNYLFSRPASMELLKPFELLCQVMFIPFSLAWRRFYKREKIVLLYGLEYAYIVLPFIFWSRLYTMKCFRIVTDHYRAETIVPVWWKKPKLFFYNAQQKYFDRYLHGMVVLSNYLYNLCIRNHVKKEKILLVPHFIDFGSDQETFEEVNNGIRIGYCGYVSVANGVLDLVKAFIIVSKNYPDAELLIIGAVDKDIMAELTSMNYQQYNIRLTGFLKKDEVERELKQCTILVNPRQKGNWAEAGFPTKMGEYFAARKPIVATLVGDLKYYFLDKKELAFAEPESPLSLAEAIEILLKDKVLKNKIAVEGYNWARENLDYLRNAKMMIEFLQ